MFIYDTGDVGGHGSVVVGPVDLLGVVRLMQLSCGNQIGAAGVDFTILLKDSIANIGSLTATES